MYNNYILYILGWCILFNSYYVVLKGNINGSSIYTNYADFQKAIDGCKDAEYEYFDNIKDANYYLTGKKKRQRSDMISLPINVIVNDGDGVDFNTINSKYSDTICIYISGGYNFGESKGYYSVLIKKNDRFKHIKKDSIENSTPNKVLIYGIIDSLDYIADNNEMEITFFTGTSLGFKGAAKNEGTNIDLINEVFDKVKKKNLKVTCVEMLGRAEEIKKYIRSVK